MACAGTLWRQGDTVLRVLSGRRLFAVHDEASRDFGQVSEQLQVPLSPKHNQAKGSWRREYLDSDSFGEPANRNRGIDAVNTVEGPCQAINSPRFATLSRSIDRRNFAKRSHLVSFPGTFQGINSTIRSFIGCLPTALSHHQYHHRLPPLVRRGANLLSKH